MSGSELLSSSADETGADETGAGAARLALSRRATRFTAAQRAYMHAYYSKGMTGTGKTHKRLIKKAAKDAGLSTPQVKVGRIKFLGIKFQDIFFFFAVSAGLRRKITKKPYYF